LSSLTDRIRGVIGGTQPPSIRNPQPEIRHTPPNLSCLEGDWQGDAFVVDRRWEATVQHGRETIGLLADRLERGAEESALFTAGSPRPPFVFFDLETTGLSGGAGTLAFLVGCAWFDGDGAFRSRQFVLTRYSDERPLLQAAGAELARAGALVSFNGKSFDAPLLETRYLFHRLPWCGAELPHVDALHPARQFWKRGDSEGCSLQALERDLIGVRRVGDVPGIEIPARYFQFLRTGDARPLAPVLEHNRLDLLTLAALTARLVDLARIGHGAARNAREAFALGRLYARGGLDGRACDALQHAVTLTARTLTSAVRVESLRLLALVHRRQRRYKDAAACWRQLLDVRGCPTQVLREATEALAIHHEHRERDLAAAKAFALRSLDQNPNVGWRAAARHRVARLEKKIAVDELRIESLENLKLEA
jgi:uncharacterized protein